MSELAEKVLVYLAENGTTNSLQLAVVLDVDHQKIVGALNSIQATDNDIISTEQQNDKHLELTAEGAEIAEKGKLVRFH